MDRVINSFFEDFVQISGDYKDDVLVILDSDREKSFTYGEIYNYIARAGLFLSNKGLNKGDTLVTILPNSVEAFVVFVTSAAYGINYAPLPCTVTEREFNNWIRLVDPGLVIRKENICEFHSSVSCVEIECDGDFEWLNSESKGMCESDYYAGSKVYLMTSGTTGIPKAMSIDINTLWSSGRAFADYYKLGDSKVRFWNYLPMSYLGGLFNLAMIPIACKGSFVISEPFSGKTILNFWEFVIRHEITAIWFVPTIVQGLLKIMKMVGTKSVDGYIDRLRIAFIGTAPIKISVKREFEEILRMPLFENFALSETTFLTAETKDNIRYREQSSVGRALPYVDIKIKEIEGVDGIGRIWVKTPFIFEGYLDENGKTHIELDSDGYFDTKDLGSFNEDGILVLSGRSRDIIKKGGNFVSLVEIESIVSQLPEVEECAAVPVEHEFYGESYLLFVVPSGDSASEYLSDRIRSWLINNIVPYKMPERILICDSFPRTASGKIEKKVLREKYNG